MTHHLAAWICVGALAAGGLLIGCNSQSQAQKETEQPSYTEVWHNGDTYVLGYKESVSQFLQTGQLSPARTYIGQSESGRNVVVQIDPDNPALVDSLADQYGDKHGVDL